MCNSTNKSIETKQALYGFGKIRRFLSRGYVLTHFLNAFTIEEEISGQFLGQYSFDFCFTLSFLHIGCIPTSVFNCNVEDRIITLHVVVIIFAINLFTYQGISNLTMTKRQCHFNPFFLSRTYFCSYYLV